MIKQICFSGSASLCIMHGNLQRPPRGALGDAVQSRKAESEDGGTKAELESEDLQNLECPLTHCKGL